ncbi:carbohydrate ABC transporter permease [Tritonibacter mobilis]|uniref:carbohydrate ABC transporter permease n=1 Tax=Tritonibacter mobilis TaxID=379347 RepID=UPI0001B8B371|nr:carbohydrate ABC transporter permease [Tritonibacter mobilis]EEW57429.1 binding-protein-dependent transport systems inner membrane component [Ruegeria sp. TrichCH4B]MCZ4270291.1 carbohydrate ABC transporter permease [Rhodobacteraceae bacterium G21628-S1]MEE2810714.1 carbohydrate ABC transporter permease [Pseudomonadota bacterium]NKX29805.1 carbohydrate ABC transporter permease [Rhodobacteraceae bacterium R_SAG6]NHM19412.1 carbohydrate ABC transporter permease [Tritonibacter mobilis]
MSAIAGQKPGLIWALRLSVVVLVGLWLFPTLGLLVSSFRTGDQIATSGWWKALFPTEQNQTLRTAAPDTQAQVGDLWVIEGNLFEEATSAEISVWGTNAREIDAYVAGDTATLRGGEELTVEADGSYRLTSASQMEGRRGARVFVTAVVPPEFTVENYETILISGGSTDNMARAFFNTLTVTIPATIIPILVAAFAAYALAWMEFPGRALLIAAIVGLLVVPLQLALIPLLKFHNEIGIGKGYVGVWMAHTGFGLPLAIYLLRNYMVGIPRDIIENARVDGATDFQIFTRIILPLSFPALASFAIFQFLWTWNDLLVAMVFLIDATGETTVMTKQIVELLGTRGGNWEILATSAFVSIAVPLGVFFAMQKYLVRGLLAGSVK